MLIGFATNDLQEWYNKKHSDVRLVAPPKDSYKVSYDGSTIISKHYIITDDRPVAEKKNRVIYFIISYAQMLIIPLWIIFCVVLTGMIFYKRELQKPIEILLDASQKISENQLDFCIDYTNKNELGKLCDAFENMRKTLDENNREMWHLLEERKRLNSAFSHDLRTPLTVLKGYNNFLEKYSEKINQNKINEILSKMNGQINRLENYTYKMSAVQKLEDIIPDYSEIPANTLKENFSGSAEYICKTKKFRLNFQSSSNFVYIDNALVMEVYENMISNAERYSENEIIIDILIENNFMKISVQDDGKVFSDKALKLATEPFYRDDKNNNSTHFGLGLYICKIICEKSGGNIDISNTGTGAKVIAKFFCGSR
ncbi:MAG: HAMP domain-containing histidine kinase [Ruminococcus sp.]|nr:HAMP domain-containing histidine kinase [Ruminococcus sp.]